MYEVFVHMYNYLLFETTDNIIICDYNGYTVLLNIKHSLTVYKPVMTAEQEVTPQYSIVLFFFLST